eukprot:COSAG02_NODE_388_length_23287_cov_109.067017_7_plen_166_part_00
MDQDDEVDSIWALKQFCSSMISRGRDGPRAAASRARAARGGALETVAAPSNLAHMLPQVSPSSALLLLAATTAEGADNGWERFPRFSTKTEAASPAADVCAVFGAAPGKQICAKSLLFNSTLDHFDPTSSARWEHRYLFRDDDWGKVSPLANGCPGPILLCTPRT